MIPKISSIIVIIQPLILMLMIKNLNIRYNLLFSYIIYFLIYFEYKRIYNPIIFNTSIAKNNHLYWEWTNNNGIENIFLFLFLLYYIIPLIIINNTLLTIFIIVTLIISLYFYFKYNTFTTIWCWLINIFLLYFIINILIINPYYEYNNLC